MRSINHLFFVSAAILATLAAPAWAQTQQRSAAETADRIDRLSRMGHREFGPRDFRGAEASLAAAKRLGAATERMAIGAREFPVRRKEILGLDLSEESRKSAEAIGFKLLRTVQLNSLGIRVDVLRAPRGVSVERALRRLRAEDPEGAYEANSLFAPSQTAPSMDDEQPISALERADLSRSGALIGIIDTGADETLDCLKNAVVLQENFGRGRAIRPRSHGTAVAALAHEHGAEKLLIADAFSGEAAFADAESLSRAIDWLASEGVVIINMSLAGPPNALLEQAIARAVAKGHVIVAAVGNEGADLPPQYPAAYPSVIGVTAVDKDDNIYDKANRGEGVDVAALGVDVHPPHGASKPLSGTSYAAPVVAAYLARRLQEEGGAVDTMQLIAEAASDLGEPGFDLTYGFGVLKSEGYRTASGGTNNSGVSTE